MIGRKLKWPKPRYQIHREAAVLFALAAGTLFAFHYSPWGGVLYLYVVKLAMQALNAQGFFDREDGSHP